MSLQQSSFTGLLIAIALLVLMALAPAGASAAAELSITKTDSADPINVGDEMVYTLAIGNAGPDSVSGVTVEDELPNRFDFVAVSTSQGACDRKGKTVTCEIGSLAAGSTATVSIRVRAKRDGQITNTATANGVDGSDYGLASASDSETTTVLAAAQPPADINCAGKKATIVGSSGADTLIGTRGRDVIVALGGKDVIRSRGGKDIICSNGGDDLLKGGGDDDVLRAAGGNDSLVGGGGDDLLKAGGGDDLLKGGRGNDALRGGPGSDRCRGGAGKDSKRSC